jgi:putative drug exporter of the RND superfamily
MDYEVFLISRIREEYLKDGDTRRAVADGLAKTARVITAAAAIMVVVFLAFLASPEVFLKVFGIGLASAIFLDATLVRMVLVPAVMQILGKANWWIPSWLERVLPTLDVERVGMTPAPEGRAELFAPEELGALRGLEMKRPRGSPRPFLRVGVVAGRGAGRRFWECVRGSGRRGCRGCRPGRPSRSRSGRRRGL